MADTSKSANFRVVDGGVPDNEKKEYASPDLRFGDGDGGGGDMDKDYLDARIEAVRAQNDASFAILGAKIDAIQPGATWQQIAAIAFVLLGSIFAILAYASDRFDSGVSSMGAIEEALDAQREINSAQDSRFERFLEAWDARNAKPETSPEN